ncbi:MAG: putative Ig domain-containing protein [Pirellulales bacterium]
MTVRLVSGLGRSMKTSIAGKHVARRRYGFESLEDRQLLAPLAWTPGVALPQPRDQAAAVADDSAVYVLGGPTQDVLRLATDGGNWTSGTQLDDPRRSLAAARLADGHFLAYGGEKNEALEAAFLYDFYDRDNSDDASNMSTPRTQLAFADDDQGRAYAIGGLNEEGLVLSSAERYDSATDVWSAIAALPSPRVGATAATDILGHIYVFGGGPSNSAASVTSTAYRYTVATNSWSAIAAMPTAVRNAVAVTGPNGKIYVLGGRAAGGVTDTVQSYDYVHGTWTVETHLPEPLSFAAATTDELGRIVLIGGRNAAGSAVSDVWLSQKLADPDTPPQIISAAPATVYATDTYRYQIAALANPLPTYEVVDGPAGLAVGASTGLVTWTPTKPQIGGHMVTIRATNFAGATDHAFTISVNDPAPSISSAAPLVAATSQGYGYQITSSGFPMPAYALLQSPVGMTVSPGGFVAWTPGGDQVGAHDVVVRASNVNGAVEQAFTIVVADGAAPSAPPNLQLVGTTNTSAALAWDAAADNVGVAGYRVYRTTRCGWRGSRTCYVRLKDNVADTTATLDNLNSGASYTFVVTAFDAAGNESLKTSRLSATTTRPPTINYLYGSQNATIQAYATHAVPTYSVYASGVPKPTTSLVSGPDGLTYDPVTGRVDWTPSDDQVGVQTATFQAVNSVGTAEVTATFNVAPNLPRIASKFTYFGLTYSSPFAVEGDPFELQLSDTFSGAPIEWSVVAGPAGMDVDAATGAVAWTPTEDDAIAGEGTATLRATNYAGATDLMVSYLIYPAGTDKQPPSVIADGIVVSNIDLNRATVSWPAADDNIAVAGYKITAYWQFRSRGLHTHYARFDAEGEGTMFDMTGLTAGKHYTLYIQAYDASGNVAAVGQRVQFVTTADPNFPRLNYAFSDSKYQAIVDRPMTIQLTDTNPIGGSTFEIISGPAGMMIDAATGLVSWTPTYDQVGYAPATFRATNAFGTRDVQVSFPVYFTGPVLGVGVSAGTAHWTPPADSSRMAGYKVYLSWSVGGRQRGSAVYTTVGAGTSFTFPFLVGGPVLFKARVSAYDAAGNVGAAYYPVVSFLKP